MHAGWGMQAVQGEQPSPARANEVRGQARRGGKAGGLETCSIKGAEQEAVTVSCSLPAATGGSHNLPPAN